jgi:transmembrane sensor
MQHPKTASTDTIDAAAAQWLSRRDRGLTASEQDAYLQWLAGSPAHGTAIARLEKVWGVLDQLNEWRPAHSTEPNPDLLAPPRRGKLYWLATAVLAVAAAVTLGLFVAGPNFAGRTARQAIIHPGPERLALEDGSVVELNTGAKVEVQFTPGERRVLLVRGEAHFVVAKNPDRPFIVSAGKMAVRAIGTAFSVSLDRQEVAVLVTEGHVQVAERPEVPADEPASPAPPEMADAPRTDLIAGQRAIFALLPAASSATAAPGLVPVQVSEMTPAQVERAMSWQGMRLEFVDMPLGDVVAEFNRYNRRKLVVSDRATAAILVGGNFRADNVDAFVRLLQASFDVAANPHDEEILLRKQP